MGGLCILIKGCVLCDISKHEIPHATTSYSYDTAAGSRINVIFEVYETKNKKGHNERMMVVPQAHMKEIPDFSMVSRALGLLIEAFEYRLRERNYNYKEFIVLSDKYSNIAGHWHRVASTMIGDDSELIAATPRIIINREVLNNS